MRILVVEDDDVTAQTVAYILAQQNYAVEIAADGVLAWEMVNSFPFDLVLLDVVLPKLDGLELCRRLRSQGFQQPILLLTGRDSSHDKAVGLDAGADDYLVKPFDAEELMARIRAVLRRGSMTASSLLEWDVLQLDPISCQVEYGGAPLALTPKEYALLELFLRNNRRVFSCGAILEHIWTFEETPGEEAVRTHIKGLRQKLKQVGAPPDLIETVYGIGYRLKPLEETRKSTAKVKTAPAEKHAAAPTRQAPAAARTASPQTRQQTLAAIAGVWNRHKQRISDQVAVIEAAATAIAQQQLTPELQLQAMREAHSLAGSLGTFGLAQGSATAREIEHLLKTDQLTQPEVDQLLDCCTVLRQQINQSIPAQAATPDPPSTPTATATDLTVRVMAVDDDPAVLEVLQELLGPWGFQVTLLADPCQFWPVLEQTAPDLLILDLHMPHWSGFDLCQALRNSDRWDSLPIMVLTADTNATTVNQVFVAGADDFISKPFAGPELVTRIVNRLERSRLLRRLGASSQPTASHPGPSSDSLPAATVAPSPLDFFTHSPDPVCLLNPDDTLHRVNPAFARLMDRTEKELLEQSFLTILRPEDRELTLQALAQLRSGMALVEVENRCLNPQDGDRWFQWKFTPVQQTALIYGVARDISSHKQQEQAWRKSRDVIELRVAERTAELVSLNQRLQKELDLARQLEEERDRVEAALRFSQARFAGILEIADDAIIAVDASQQITLFNQGAEKIFGYTASEVLGQALDILLPASAVAAHRQHVKGFAQSSGEARRMGDRRPILGRRKDGSEFPAEASISRLDLGKEQVFTVILRDITERQRAQHALQQSEERLRLLLDGVEDYAIFMLDPQGYVESWNPGAEKIQGYQAEEIIGQHFSRFYPGEEQNSGKPALLLQQAAKEGRLEAEGWRIRADGCRFYADTVITALRDGLGNLQGFTEITRDITEAKRREAERQAVERMKDEFVSVVSHELRTPLTSIHGSLRMLASGLLSPESERGQRLLQIASDSTDRLVRLINDILDLERIESGKVSMVKGSCNVADLVREAVDGVQAIAEKVGIQIIATTVNVQIQADRDRIIQTLTNLLSNAIKFSPVGSTVWVSVEPADQRPQRKEATSGQRALRSHKKASRQTATTAGHMPCVLFTVKDQGRGIPTDKLETIFERFQQVDASDSRHQDGTGLGLTICRSIVQQHGGQIWVESEVGQGSSFYFSLPVT